MILINQPDLGQTFLLTLTWVTMIFISGFNMIILSILGLLFLITISLLIFLLPEKFGYVFLRIKTFFDPKAGDNFQSQKALETIKEGGLTVNKRIPIKSTATKYNRDYLNTKAKKLVAIRNNGLIPYATNS